MVSLDGIPTELVELICSFLSTGDTLSVCTSSKSLYSIAHPLLFRHVTISWDQRREPFETPNITSLLQFILRNPHYARYIKTVNIPDVVYDACLAWSRRLKKGNPWHWSSEDKELARAAIEKCVLARPDDWYKAVVEKPNLGAITALILGQCTHLESLTVDASFIPTSNGWFAAMLRPRITPSLSMPEPPARPPMLPRLAHVAVTQDDMRGLHPMYDPDLEMFYDGDYEGPGAEPPDALFLFFYLPRIASISFGYMPGGGDRQPWDPTLEYHTGLRWPLPYHPRPVGLTSLRLDCITAAADAVEWLLRHTPNLQSLVYDCKLASSVSPINLTTLRQGLDHISGTLKHLVIRYDIEADEALESVTLVSVTTGSLGNLDGMAALEDLEISPFVLLGQVTPRVAAPLAAILPRGLRRLVLTDDLWLYDAFHTWTAESVEALLVEFFAGGGCGAYKTATPLLEEFVMELTQEKRSVGLPLYVYWGDEANRARLRRLVEGQGVRCAFRMYQGYNARYEGEVRCV